MQYRKKPVVIEAMQFDGTMASYGAIQRWAGLAPGPDEFSIGGSPHDDPCGHTLSIPTLEGVMVANPGDWIIRGVKGEFYPCKPDIFAASYVAENYLDADIATDCTQGLDIGGALCHLRAGREVRRAGWNGKGMSIVLMPARQLPPFSSQAPGAKVNDRTTRHIGFDTPLDSLPYIAMWTADQKWQPGWVCSQADLLANDWQVAE